MRQRAVVIECKGKEAIIEVSRATMCDGCEKNGGCEGHCEITGLLSNGGKMKTRADNVIGAVAGDMVEVETESRRVLFYAALVFVLPLLICALFGYAAHLIWNDTLATAIAAVCGFVLTFCEIAIYDRLKRKKTPEIKITAILGHTEQKNEDTQDSEEN